MEAVNFTENPQPMFIAGFDEYTKLYIGVKNVFIAEAGDANHDAGYLYAVYVDDNEQKIGPVSDYYMAVEEGYQGSLSDWVRMIMTVPNKKDKQAAKTSPIASGTANAFIDTITQNANGEITATKRTVAVTNHQPTLDWDTVSDVATVAGTTIKVKMPTKPYADTYVKQSPTTANADYRILLSHSANDTEEPQEVWKNTSFKYNPSTHALTTGGTVNGYTLNAASAKPVADSISVNDTSTNLPTAKAVADFVKGNYNGTVTSVGTGVGLTGGPITTTGTISLKLKDDTYSTQTAGNPTATAGRQYPVVPDSAGNLSVNVPWTDTKVTSAANHYTPTEASGSDKSASASGATAAWSIDVVKGVTLKTDGKGHVTDISVTSGKIPANPNTDTKVTSAANHYTPTEASGQDKTASASGATAAWSIDVVKGITLKTDGKGHVTSVSVTPGKIPANPWTALVGATSSANGTGGYISANPPKDGYNTKFFRADGTWATPGGTYSLPLAANGTRGGIQLGYSQSGKNYPVQLSSEKAYVNVPWENTTYSAGTGLSLSNGAFAVRLSYSASGKNYAVAADSSGNLYVNVPWTDNNTWTALTGATSSANGTVGYINATPPKDGYNTKFFRADGTWAVPANTTYSAGTGLSLSSGTFAVKLNYSPSGKNYAVAADSNGNLYVNVPWSDTTYSLPLAANGTRGGIQIGYTQSGKNYPVQLSSEKAYVNVPWENTTYSNVSTSAAGLCPTLPSSGGTSKWLRGDGTWQTLPAGTAYTAGTGLSLSGTEFSVSFGTSGTTVAYGNHTHTLTLASGTAPSGTSTVSLAANTSYKLTAGGKDIYIKTPADSNTTYTAGDGLTLSGTQFKANLLNGSTALTVASAAGTTASGRVYAVELDSNSKLCVRVPWSNTTYSAGTGISLSSGVFSAKLLNGSTALTVASASGTTATGRVYAVEQDSSGYLCVRVPWSNTTYSAGAGLALSSTTFKAKLASETALTVAASAVMTSSSAVVPVVLDSSGNLAVKLGGTNGITCSGSTIGIGDAKIGHNKVLSNSEQYDVPTGLTTGRAFIIVATTQGCVTCFKYGVGDASVIAGASEVLSKLGVDVSVNQQDRVRIVGSSQRNTYVSVIPMTMVPVTPS